MRLASPWTIVTVCLVVLLVWVVLALAVRFIVFLHGWPFALAMVVVLWVSGCILLELFHRFGASFVTPVVVDTCRFLTVALALFLTVACLWSMVPFYFRVSRVLFPTNLVLLFLCICLL